MSLPFVSSPKPNETDEPPAALRWKYGPRTVRKYFVGVDVGQAIDPTAIVILEFRQQYQVNMHYSTEHRPHGDPQYWIVDAAKLPLGMLFPDQAQAIAAIAARDPLAGNAEMIVDRSGLGRPVVDELRKLRVPKLTGVVIGPGEDQRRDGAYNWRVSKLQLVTTLSAKLNDGTFKIAEEMPLRDELVKELQELQVSFTSSGAMTFAAAGSGHDDLAIAAALALWGAAGRPSYGAFRPKISGMW